MKPGAKTLKRAAGAERFLKNPYFEKPFTGNHSMFQVAGETIVDRLWKPTV